VTFLQRCPKSRTLGAVARHRGTGLTHVLLGGRNIRQWSSPYGVDRAVPRVCRVIIKAIGLGTQGQFPTECNPICRG
jgi:hypothetical protein